MPEAAHRYRGEVWIDDATGEANFHFHVAGGSFADAREALRRMIGVMQHRLDNERRCPFYEPPARAARASFAQWEDAAAAVIVRSLRARMDAQIAALIMGPPRKYHPAVSLLAGCVVAWRVLKVLRRAAR